VSWREALLGDPLPWLLEPGDPSIRYWTLRDVLDRPADDAEVVRVHETIAGHAPVAALLSAQKKAGYWIKRDYYLPKHRGTFWTLSVLADMGLTAEHKQVARACEFMFTFQREDGAFCRRRRVAGQGIVWAESPGPCTHARIVRFLIQFGYGQDPRVRQGIDWLLDAQREHGMWDCGRPERPGCLRATFDVLRVAALDAEAAAHPAVALGAEKLADLLMERGMTKYHVGIPWTVFQYPYFDYGLIPALDALARLSYTLDHSKVAAATDYLLSRQQPDGTWHLDEIPDRPPLELGQAGTPHKWITLDALRAIKILSGRNL
jgi:hypothetical protein